MTGNNTAEPGYAENAQQLEIQGDWQKSTFSEQNRSLIVGVTPSDQIAVSNSIDPSSPALLYSRADWQAFLNGAKAGEFDSFGLL